MKYLILMIVLLNNLLLFGQTPANDPHWQLVWQDDFNSFDNNKWLKVDWAEHGEPQLYLASNVSTSGGNLVIKVDDNPTYCDPNQFTIWGACWPCVDNTWYYYTSGWVETKEVYNTQYGYIESRIKMPYGYGFWPAFWTYVGSGLPAGTPSNEIDIVENLGHMSSSVMTTNLHHDYCNSNRPDWDPGSQQCTNFPPSNFSEASPSGYNWNSTWHTYAVEWSPSKIIWYVDGIPIRVYNQTGQTDPQTGKPIYPSDSVRIILNLATVPGYPPNSSTPFPSYMYVDYVKVYELNNDCNTTLSVCNYNFGAHDNKVKKSITIGDGSCVNSLNSGDNVYLRAGEGVTINGDFNVPIGAQLYIDANTCY